MKKYELGYKKEAHFGNGYMGVNVFGCTETEQSLQSLYFRSALSPVKVDIFPIKTASF